uniref:Uncharacterized protein n=1 Tax=Arundo donax TaxID=35708 RepID=A0A0A9BCL4_ARUDO
MLSLHSCTLDCCGSGYPRRGDADPARPVVELAATTQIRWSNGPLRSNAEPCAVEPPS